MLLTSLHFDYPIKNSMGIYAQDFKFTLEGKNSGVEPTIKRTLYTTKYGQIIIEDANRQTSISYHNKHGIISSKDHGYIEYKVKRYRDDNDLLNGYVNTFGKMGNVKNINKDYFKPWLDLSNNKASNDLAIDSLRKANNAFAKRVNQKLPDALSFKNIAGIRSLNESYKLFNKKISYFTKLGILNADTPLQPILNDDQLMDLSNKLAGEVGEELVDQAVKIDNKKFHNVILDYNYGNKQNKSANNQIDNIFITHTGIYCVEVKTRNIKTGYFDMQDLVNQGIKDQIGYHKDAVLNVLRDPNNHLKEILPENLSSLIYNVVVIINRKEKDFKITNADELTKFGAHILKLEDLNLAMTNGLKEDIYLTDEQIDKIAKAIEEKNIGSKGERIYSDNIVFFGDTKIGNKFTLTEDDILKRLPPEDIYDKLLFLGIENEKKKALSQDQKEMIDFIEYAFMLSFYNVKFTKQQLHDFKNPLNLPEVESNHEYDQLFKEQEEEKSNAYSGLLSFNDATAGKYLYLENYDLKDAAKYYENQIEEEKRETQKAEAERKREAQEAEIKRRAYKAMTKEKAYKAKKEVANAFASKNAFSQSKPDVNDFLEQKSQGSSCLSSAALIALIVGIIPALLHMLM